MELLVVITIITALAGVAAPQIAKHLKTKDRLVAIHNAGQLHLALTEFAEEYGSLPDRETATAVAERTAAPIRLVTLGCTHYPLVQREIEAAFIHWREHIATDGLIQAWEERLAFRGQQVQVTGNPPIHGELLGLEADGSLRLRDANDKSVIIRFGDVSLRPGA